MEVFDDWGSRKRTPPQSRGKEPVPSQPASVAAIRAGLAKFDSQIINVHCYEDVGYPWVQVVFEKIIGPGMALRLGDALAKVAGADNVYLNSLRPKAVYFLLEPAFDPRPDLPASRYGERLAAIKSSWSRPDAETSA